MEPTFEIFSIVEDPLSDVEDRIAKKITRTLYDLGYSVHRQMKLPNERTKILPVLKTAMASGSFVISLGGLDERPDNAPTLAGAVYFDSEFTYQEKIAKQLDKKSLSKEQLANLSTKPHNAEVFQTPFSPYAGLLFKKNQTYFTTLPLHEKAALSIWNEHILPRFKEYFKARQKNKRDSIYTIGASINDIELAIEKAQEMHSDITMKTHEEHGVIQLVLEKKAWEDKDADLLFAEPKKILLNELKPYIVPSPHIAFEVHRLLLQQKKTLCTAESCTGGTISSKIVENPGASNYFLGSLVSYANELKSKALSVPEELLQKHGAVSKEVALAMWEGALSFFNADLAIATTGIAGPDGGSEEKPVGTVWIAVGEKGKKPLVEKLYIPHDRNEIIQTTVNISLAKLLNTLKIVS